MRFEDLIAWQRARELTAAVYRATSDGPIVKDFGLRDQMRRSALSVMSNIAEGFDRGRPAEFHHALGIAKGSCAELQSQLYVARDANYVDQQVFASLQTAAQEVGRIIGGLRTSVAQRRASSTRHSPLVTRNSHV